MKYFLFLLCFVLVIATQSTAQLVNVSTMNACGLLADRNLKAKTEWKNYGNGMWGCNSPMVEIGKTFPLSNDIAYYAEGTKNNVESLKILLNINNKDDSTKSLTEFLKNTDYLIYKATGGKTAPPSFINAAKVGASCNAKVGETMLELKRTDWPTGKGYDIKVIIK